MFNSLCKILITAACGDVGYSTIRALSREKCYSLYGTDMLTLCPVRDLLEGFYTVPRADHPDYLKIISNYCTKNGIGIILPISEMEISIFDKNRQFFADRQINLLINNSSALDIFFDKLKTANYFSRLGYTVPKTFILDLYDGSLPYPVICKPRKGCGSAGCKIIHSNEELAEFKRVVSQDVLVQEYIGEVGEEYTTGVFANGERCYTISFRRQLGASGFSHIVCSTHEPFLHTMAQAVVRDLDLRGCINIQTRKVGDIHIPFEVNPRISSTVMFRSLVGFHDAHWWIGNVLGRSYTYAPMRSGAVGIRYLSEAVFFPDTA